EGSRDQVVPAAEVAVDGVPGHLRLPGDVLDRRVGEPEPLEAGLGGVDEPLPGGTVVVEAGVLPPPTGWGSDGGLVAHGPPLDERNPGALCGTVHSPSSVS